jgi:hypothetical protein
MFRVLADSTEPPGVVTVILPLVAPAGITNFNEVELAPDNNVTASEPTVTVAPFRDVPLTVTTVTPFLPVAGENDETIGAGGVTVNDLVK